MSTISPKLMIKISIRENVLTIITKNCKPQSVFVEMPYAALAAVKWLSKMLTLIMADMAVSGPKLATFVSD